MTVSLLNGMLPSIRICIAMGLLSLSLSGVVIAKPVVGFEVIVTPQATPDGRVGGLEVEERIAMGDAPSVLSLVLPLAMPGAPHNADAITALKVHDAGGDVEMSSVDSEGESFPLRRWTAQRPVVGQVTVRYNAGLQKPQAGGPPYGMKAAGKGVAGSTKSFLLIAENTSSQASQFAWDLAQLAPQSLGKV